MPDRSRRTEQEQTSSTETQSSTTSAPTTEAPANDASNSDAVADVGLGANVCEVSLEGLEAAVEAGDGGEAWRIADNLPPDDLNNLKGDTGLQERTLALIGADHSADLLYRLQHPIGLYLQLADIHCASSATALQRVLADVGIATATDVAEHAADLAGLSSFLVVTVIGDLIEGSPAMEQAELISTAAGVDLFTAIYSTPALDVLTDLATSSDTVLDLFITSEPARSLFLCNPDTLNQLILTAWSSGHTWFQMLGGPHPDELRGFFGLDPAGWAQALTTPLLEGNAEDVALVDLNQPLGQDVINLIAAVDPLVAAQVCRAMLILPVDSIIHFGDNGWLTTLDIGLELQRDAEAGQLGRVAGTEQAVNHLMPLGWVEDVMPGLVDIGALPAIYGVSTPFRAWVDVDMARFEVVAKANPGPWIAAFIAASHVQPLLDFAVNDAATWRAAVNDAQFQSILGKLQQPCAQEAVEGVWALWTDAARSADCGFTLYHTVFGLRMWSSGQQPTNPMSDWTDATSGITYERRNRFDTVDPDQTAMNTYLARLRLLPRGQVAVCAVGFGNRLMTDFKKKTPAPADADWGDTRAAGVARSYTTSLYFPSINFILMAATSTGAIPANVGVQTARPDGEASGAGGARTTTDAAGATVALPATTDQALTYFENHAQHEVGHGVGNKLYAGMSRKGDDEAKKYAKWENSTEAAMRAAYFSGAPNSVTDVEDSTGTDKTLSKDEIGKYLTNIVRTGAQPGASAAAGDAGRVLTELPGMTMQDRVDSILLSAAGTEDLPLYTDTVMNNGRALPGGAYEYHDFAPTGSKAHIWCNVEGGFRKYDKTTKTNIVPLMGWYSMCSHSEMFAEIYTQYYSTAAHAAPAAQNSVDWSAWFTSLEASPDAQLQGGVAPAVTGVGGAPRPGAAAPAAPGGGGAGAAPGGGGIVGDDPHAGLQLEGTPI